MLRAAWISAYAVRAVGYARSPLGTIIAVAVARREGGRGLVALSVRLA